MPRIHPTALVDCAAELAADVEVGPYAIVGPHVRIGAGTSIGAYTVIAGHTTIGQSNRIYPHNSLGLAPQDKKYAGEPTRLEIGTGNTIREFCTFNTGTAQDQGVTRLGNDNWIMAYVHVAHDCQLGDHIIMANLAQLAGHVQVGDWAIIGGHSGVLQFVRLGAHSLVGFATRCNQDVPPYVTAAGNPMVPTGLNTEGLRRRNFSPERISAIKRAYRSLYRQGLTLSDAIAALQQQISQHSDAQIAADLALMRTFLSGARRGIVR